VGAVERMQALREGRCHWSRDGIGVVLEWPELSFYLGDSGTGWPQGRLILCCRSETWIALLCRDTSFKPAKIETVFCGDLPAVAKTILRYPASFVVWELDWRHWGDWLRLVELIERLGSWVGTAVVAAGRVKGVGRLRGRERLLRMAGAAQFVDTPCKVKELAVFIRRHFRQLAAVGAGPGDYRSIELPWGSTPVDLG